MVILPIIAAQWSVEVCVLNLSDNVNHNCDESLPQTQDADRVVKPAEIQEKWFLKYMLLIACFLMWFDLLLVTFYPETATALLLVLLT